MQLGLTENKEPLNVHEYLPGFVAKPQEANHPGTLGSDMFPDESTLALNSSLHSVPHSDVITLVEPWRLAMGMIARTPTGSPLPTILSVFVLARAFALFEENAPVENVIYDLDDSMSTKDPCEVAEDPLPHVPTFCVELDIDGVVNELGRLILPSVEVAGVPDENVPRNMMLGPNCIHSMQFEQVTVPNPVKVGV